MEKFHLEVSICRKCVCVAIIITVVPSLLQVVSMSMIALSSHRPPDDLIWPVHNYRPIYKQKIS